MAEYKTLDCGCKIEIRGYTPDGRPRYYIDLENLPDCPKVWKMLGDGLTKGVFQLEQGAGTKWCKILKPESLENMSALAAGIRPGAAKSVGEDGMSMMEHFCNRKNGLEETQSYHPALDDILGVTHGVLLFQEQAIRIAIKIAGFSAEKADALRKAIGKKIAQEMSALKDDFINGCVKVGLVNKEQAEFIFAWIEKSQRYSFNRCIFGDMSIKRHGKTKTPFRPTIEEMYKIRYDISYAKQTKHLDLYKKMKFYNRIGKSWSLRDDGRLYPNTILDIQEAGIQPGVKIILEDGRFIKVTKNHKFPTPDGEKLAEQLKVGHELFISGEYESPTNIRGKFSTFTNADRLANEVGKTSGKGVFGERNRWYINGSSAEFEKNNKIIPMLCARCGVGEEKRLELHHKDGNREDSSLNNLERLCSSCHKKAEYKLGRTKRGERGYPSFTMKIKEILPVEPAMTYDVTMEAPYHTFATDQDIVTCNSHAHHYGVYGYKTAYLKAHAPLSFYKSWLQHADDITEISALIEDSKYFDIKINPPDIREIDKPSFFIKDDQIYFGLANVKNVSINDVKELQKLPRDWMKKDWDYFLLFISDHLSLTAMNKWIETGAFRVFNLSRQEMLYQYNQVWKELGSAKNAKFDRRDFIREAYLAGKISTLAEGVALVASGLKKDGGGCHRKDDIQKFRDMHHLLVNPAVQRADTPDWIAWCEEEYLGSALTCSKVDSYGALHTTCTCLEFVRGYKGYTVVTAELKGINEIEMKRGPNAGDPMAFVKLSDGSCTMDGVMFTQTLKEFKPLLVPGQVLAFQGERTKKGTFQVLKVAPAAGV